MKKKIDVDMDAYRILGACNPQMAHQAIGMEPRVGAMLPCNVILRQVEGGIEVSAIDPIVSMQGIDNDQLHAVAGQVRDMMQFREFRGIPPVLTSLRAQRSNPYKIASLRSQ